MDYFYVISVVLAVLYCTGWILMYWRSILGAIMDMECSQIRSIVFVVITIMLGILAVQLMIHVVLRDDNFDEGQMVHQNSKVFAFTGSRSLIVIFITSSCTSLILHYLTKSILRAIILSAAVVGSQLWRAAVYFWSIKRVPSEIPTPLSMDALLTTNAPKALIELEDLERPSKLGEEMEKSISTTMSFMRAYEPEMQKKKSPGGGVRGVHQEKAVHCGGKNISDLPRSPRCPELSWLFLDGNHKLKIIPPDFFMHMPLLSYLDLSRTGITFLPESLFNLHQLTRLHLEHCESLTSLDPKVGNLKLLEVLNMEGTPILHLPVEIEGLVHLTELQVSLYGYNGQDQENTYSPLDTAFPLGVISTLYKLRHLSIDVSPDDERWNAIAGAVMNEICTLERLIQLTIYFPSLKHLQDFCMNKKEISQLRYFNFKVGAHSERIMNRIPNFSTEYWRFLKYIHGECASEDINMVLQQANGFHLDRHLTAKKFTEFGIDNMSKLTRCIISECNEMQSIIDENDADEERDALMVGLESLRTLSIHYMKNLTRIWETSATLTKKRWLINLKSLTLSTCPKLTTIFTVALLENLEKLQQLYVTDCPAIKSLVSLEKGVEESGDYLPQLRLISLHYVPGLVSISSDVCIAPELGELSFYNCPRLRSLSMNNISSKKLRKIMGEMDWWEALKWENPQLQRNQFDCIFEPINEDKFV